LAGTLQSLGNIGRDPQMANQIVQALIESTRGGAAPARMPAATTPSSDPQLQDLLEFLSGSVERHVTQPLEQGRQGLAGMRDLWDEYGDPMLPAEWLPSAAKGALELSEGLPPNWPLPGAHTIAKGAPKVASELLADAPLALASLFSGPGGVPIRAMNRLGLSGGRVPNLPDARLFVENALKNESRLATTPKEAVREQFEGMRDKLLGGGTTFKIPPEVKNLVKEEGYLGFDTVGEVAQSILKHFDFASRWEIPSKFVPQLKKWREMVLRENPEILAREFKTRKSIMKGSKRFPGVGSD
jgi:hypothetical protein